MNNLLFTVDRFLIFIKKMFKELEVFIEKTELTEFPILIGEEEIEMDVVKITLQKGIDIDLFDNLLSNDFDEHFIDSNNIYIPVDAMYEKIKELKKCKDIISYVVSEIVIDDKVEECIMFKQ